MKAFVQYGILYMAKGMGLILRDPIFFIMVLYSITMYKRQIESVQGRVAFKTLFKNALFDIVIGVIVGLLISMVLSYLGLSFYVDTNILILIPVAILLIMIHPRFGCFSYVVPIAFLIEGLGNLFNLRCYTLDYRMLIYLVGILHIIEGFLVIGFGAQHAQSVPVYENKRLVTYKMMRHIWIVPLFFTLSHEQAVLPLYALLAYGDHAKVRSARQQSLLTGLLILLFGLILFVLGRYIHPSGLQVGGIILLIPVLHEMIFVVEEYCNKK